MESIAPFSLVAGSWGMTLGEMLDRLGPMGILGLLLGILVVVMLGVDALTSLRHELQDRRRRNHPEAGLLDPLEKEDLADRPWVASMRFRRRPRVQLNRHRMFKWPAELPDHSPDDD